MPEDTPTSTRAPGGSFIQKKAGPFPLWGWAVIIGAAFGVVYIVRKRGTTYPSAVGQMSGASSGTGVLSGDPLTLGALSQAMNNLASSLAQFQPPPTTAVNPPSSLWQTVTGGGRVFSGQGVEITQDSAGNVSMFGGSNAPWLTGRTPAPGGFGSPEGVWNWLAAQFSYLNLGLPPDSGVMTGFNPDGTTWTLNFRRPGASGPQFTPGGIISGTAGGGFGIGSTTAPVNNLLPQPGRLVPGAPAAYQSGKPLQGIQ